jgi:hypothetical protein
MTPHTEEHQHRICPRKACFQVRSERQRNVDTDAGCLCFQYDNVMKASLHLACTCRCVLSFKQLYLGMCLSVSSPRLKLQSHFFKLFCSKSFFLKTLSAAICDAHIEHGSGTVNQLQHFSEYMHMGHILHDRDAYVPKQTDPFLPQSNAFLPLACLIF